MAREKGIILITSIVLVVVMVMFLGAALALGPTNLAAGQATLYQGQAQRAAESGVQYALSQLRQDPTWVGARNMITVNTPDLWVEEDNGNVVGLLRQPDGSWSQFRLRFNAQDGPGGLDGLDDPAVLSFDHPYVSVNNLLGGVTAPVRRGDGPGASVTTASQVACEAPIWSVCLSAEGKAGPACNQLSPANPNPALGGASRCAVEGIYQIPDMGPTIQEAGSMSARDFTVGLRGNTGQVQVVSNTNNTPRLRSRGEVKVDAGGAPGSYISPDGEVRINPTAPNPTLQASYTAVPAPTGVSVVAEDVTDPFYQLAWNDVKKASPSGAKLAAGTYVWWDNGSGGSLHYYDMDYASYATWIQNPANANNPGVTPPPLPPEVTMDAANHKLTIKGNVYVDPTGHSTNELNLVPRLGGAEAPPNDPEATNGGAGGGIDATDIATNFTGYGGTQNFPATTAGWANMANNISGNNQDLLAFIRGTGQPSDGYVKLVDSNNQGITMIQWSNVTPTTGTIDMAPGAALINFWLQPQVYRANGMSFAYSAGVIPQAAGGGGGGPLDANNGELNPPGVSDTLSAADLSIDFAPPAGTPATLTSEGTVRLTSAIGGTDGSITSGGDIRITGMGAQFAANQSVGVNMYAAGDIVFSTLDNNGGVYTYRDVNLKGVIYAQGDFVARLGSPALPGAWGNVNLDGCLIAYGGDPAGAPGTRPNKGKVDLRAENVNLRFDATYMGGLTAQPPADFKVECISWTNRL